MDIEKSIVATRQGFEERFASEEFYNKQTQDEEHLRRFGKFTEIRRIISGTYVLPGLGQNIYPGGNEDKNR